MASEPVPTHRSKTQKFFMCGTGVSPVPAQPHTGEHTRTLQCSPLMPPHTVQHADVSAFSTSTILQPSDEEPILLFLQPES